MLSFENFVFEGGLGNFGFFHTGGQFFFSFLVVNNGIFNGIKPVTAGKSESFLIGIVIRCVQDRRRRRRLLGGEVSLVHLLVRPVPVSLVCRQGMQDGAAL
jgi:hypothetical protein